MKQKIRLSIINTISIVVLLVLHCATAWGGDLTIDGDLVVKSNLLVKGVLDVSSNIIANVGTPISSNDAVNKVYVDGRFYPVNNPNSYITSSSNITNPIAGVSAASVAAGAAKGSSSVQPDGSVPMSGPLNMNGNLIVNLGTPVNSADAVTKAYVDQKAITNNGAAILGSLVISGKVNAVSQNNLVLWYRFDADGATVSDLSGNNNIGTVYGAKWTSEGWNGGSYCFNGTNEWIEAAPAPSLDITTQLTILVWMRAPVPVGAYMHIPLVCKQPTGSAGDNHAGNYELRLESSGKPSFGNQIAADSTTETIGGEGVVDDGKWHLVGVTVDAPSKTIKFYVDGMLTKTATAVNVPIQYPDNEPLRIAIRKDAYVYGGIIIDEVSMYKRVLSDSENTDIYNNSKVSRVTAAGSIWVGDKQIADTNGIVLSALPSSVITRTSPNFANINLEYQAGVTTLIARTSAQVRNWWSVASSADGLKLVAGVQSGYIYTSDDGGVTWTERTGAGEGIWYGVASSADGGKLIAAASGGYIYTSTNGGDSWTPCTNAGIRNWCSVASSANGTKLLAGTDGYIYTSNDGGVTWTERTNAGSGLWCGLASSADGSMLAAAAFGGYICTSADGGLTWNLNTNAGARAWSAVVASANGSNLAACVSYGSIYTSTDGGTTWTVRGSAGEDSWWSLASSSDGMKLVTGVDGGYIKTSSDGGATWIEDRSQGAPLTWYGCSSSADGSRIAACAHGNYIYTSGLVTQTLAKVVTSDNITLKSDDWTNTVAGMSAAAVADGASKGAMALQISSTLSSNAVMKDGSVVWTGVDDHGGHKIINVDFSEVTNIPASAIVGNVGISFTNVPQLGDLGMGVYTNKPQ